MVRDSVTQAKERGNSMRVQRVHLGSNNPALNELLKSLEVPKDKGDVQNTADNHAAYQDLQMLLADGPGTSNPAPLPCFSCGTGA